MSSETAANVQVTKQFATSRENLYNAWISPEELKQWWRPMDKQLVAVENDVRQGGKVVYRFDTDLQIHGEYTAVEEGKKLVYSWKWDLPEESVHRGDYRLTVIFSGEGNESELAITQENVAHEHAIKPHEEGWEKSLADLKSYLETKK